jgi:antirestriction protein
MPRIYAACLASYNSGRLHGTWIDCDQDPEDIQAEIAAMLAASPTPLAEEYAIHDHEGFEGIRIGEWEDLADLSRHGRALEEHGIAWAIYVGNIGAEFATDESFRDAYRGAWDSCEAFAESLADDSGALASVPDEFRGHIDWESYTREMFMGDFWSGEGDGRTHVFANL